MKKNLFKITEQEKKQILEKHNSLKESSKYNVDINLLFEAKQKKIDKANKSLEKYLRKQKEKLYSEKIEEEELARKDKTDENDVDELLNKIIGESDNVATPEELEEIIRQGA